MKVYLKGFKRPIAVLGEPVFEDERFFIIQNDVFRRKILWENILFFEEMVTPKEPNLPTDKISVDDPKLKSLVKQAIEAKAAKKAAQVAAPNNNVNVSQVEPEDLEQPVIQTTAPQQESVDITVVFSGFKNDQITMSVPASLLTGEYTGALGREIFGNASVQSIMGDFVVVGKPKLDGRNVYLDTKSAQELKGKVDAIGSMMGAVSKASESMGKFSKLPSMSLDNSFSMTASPFEKPVKFSA
jgi:hypothetical protein